MAGELSNIQIAFSVAGAGQSAAEIGRIGRSLSDVGSEAQKIDPSVSKAGSGLVNFGKNAAAVAASLGAIAAASKLVSAGLSGVAESDGAQASLAALKLTAEQTEVALRDIEGIKLITGDKISAAELWGRVLNGNTGVLRQYGIHVREGADQVERLAALAELSSRGLAKQEEALKTTTGQFAFLGKQLGDLAEKGFGKLFGLESFQSGLEAINIMIGGFEDRRDMLNQLAPPVTSFTSEVAKFEPEGAKFSSRLEAIARSAGIAGRALEDADIKIAALNSRLAWQNDDADVMLQEQIASIEEAKAAGKMTPEEAAKARRAAESQARTRGAERARSMAGQRLEVEQGAFAQANQAREDTTRQIRSMPEGDEKERAKKEFEAVDQQLKEARKRKEAAEEEVKRAEAELRKARALERQSTAQSEFETRQEKERAEKERQKEQQAFGKAAGDFQKGQSKAADAQSERDEDVTGFADRLRNSAQFAASPEQRREIMDRADRIARGGASAGDIESARSLAARSLQRRARGSGKRAQEAATAMGDLDSSASAATQAVEANAAKVGSDAQQAAAAMTAMAAAMGPAFQVIMAQAAQVTAILKQVEAKAGQAQRTSGMGGG